MRAHWARGSDRLEPLDVARAQVAHPGTRPEGDAHAGLARGLRHAGELEQLKVDRQGEVPRAGGRQRDRWVRLGWRGGKGELRVQHPDVAPREVRSAEEGRELG